MKLNYRTYCVPKPAGYRILICLKVLLLTAVIATCALVALAKIYSQPYMKAIKTGGNSFREQIICTLERPAGISFYDSNEGIESLASLMLPPPVKKNIAEAKTLDVIPEGKIPIIEVDISGNDVFSLINETEYRPNLYSLFEAGWNAESKSSGAGYTTVSARNISRENEPSVLILHTHGTEAYSNGSWCEPGYNFRTADTEENVVAVGAALENELSSLGVAVIHCTIMHDKTSYVSSYANAATTIKEYLEKYPSIRYVIDIHRDALTKANGDIMRPVTYDIDGSSVAQVMSVVGTDYLGAAHPGWSKNLTLAAVLQSRLESICENITRPINLRGAAFNEQYTSGSLLLEIGSTGNTVEEAKKAARIVGRALASIINQDM